MGFRRFAAMLLSAVLLLSPAAMTAEEYAVPAGELTTTALSDSYYGGYQINVGLGFDADVAATGASSERMKAAAVLLDKAQVNLSFYDDFGTARIRGELTLDGAQVVSGDMLIFEDGSVQMVTSLTGNMAFTLPAGTVTQSGVALASSDWTQADYEKMSAFERLQVTTPNMVSTVLNLLLGWVSGTQMETGELYTFDYDTYIDATETRDAVASRMIGKIRSTDLIEFVWNIVTHIRDKEHDFQAALAMSIGKLGLTRYEGRRIIDGLFPNEEVDPEYYHIQPSSEIVDDGALFTYNDLRYLLCKLDMNLMHAWSTGTTDNVSSMIVGYDDFGEMVGLDMVLEQVSDVYPFEGDLTYSIRTDDAWQRIHTAHGELQLYNDQRLIGDLDAKNGEDVSGVNANHFNGQIDLVNTKDGSAVGFGVNSALDFALTQAQDGENISGGAALYVNAGGESAPLISADVDAVSALTEMGAAITGTALVKAYGLPDVTVNVSVDCAEYDEAPFEGGQAVDLSQDLTKSQKKAIKEAAAKEAAALGVRFALKPTIVGNALKLVEGLGE